MAIYLVKETSEEGTTIAIIQAENNDALVPKLVQLGVGMNSFISHIETLPFDENGVYIVHEENQE